MTEICEARASQEGMLPDVMAQPNGNQPTQLVGRRHKTSEMKFIIYDKSREEFQVPWTGKDLAIGRRADADIQVNEPTMSGLHAKIFAASDGMRIRDLDSLNGTQINGVRVVESLLYPGDQIKIGRAMIVVSGTTGTTAAVDPLPKAPEEDNKLTTQTVKISLARLRSAQAPNLEEDEHLRLLLHLFEALEGALDTHDVLEKVREILQKTFHRARVYVFLAAGEEWHDPNAPAEIRRPSLTFATEAARSRSAILSTSLPEDKRFSGSESARISGIETAIAAPISCDAQSVAVLYVDRLGLPPFSPRDLHILGIAANHVTAVLERMSRINALHSANAELLETRESLAELNRNLEQLVEKRTEEIQRQAKEIHQLAEAKDELLGIAAHDIRGPLTVIQGTCELLRLRIGEIDDSTLERSLNLMHGACRGLTQLLSELLDAKAIESGKITLLRRPYDVRSLIETSLPVARLAAEDKKVGLVIESQAGLEIEADPRRLGQAITNLVLNAVKFSESGTRILVRGAADGLDRALIEVEDQGIGIPEDEIDGIFGTFQQGEAGKQFGGSGLGLMIARRLVELHDGTLSVRSEVGVGTRFTLSLPRLSLAEEPLSEQAS